jgi:hypothetical protein
MQSDLNVTFTVKDADICSESVWPEGDRTTLGAGLLFWGEDNKSYFQFGAIHSSPGASNKLRVKANGNAASLFINGTKVRDLRGQPPKGGWRFGLSGDNLDKQ